MLDDSPGLQSSVLMPGSQLVGLSPAKRSKMCFFKPSALEYEEEAVPIPPLFFGLRLAGGVSDGRIIYSFYEQGAIDHLQVVAEICRLFSEHPRGFRVWPYHRAQNAFFSWQQRFPRVPDVAISQAEAASSSCGPLSYHR